MLFYSTGTLQSLCGFKSTKKSVQNFYIAKLLIRLPLKNYRKIPVIQFNFLFDMILLIFF